MKKAVSGLAKLLLIMIVIVCLLIIVFILFIFLNSKSDKIEQNDSVKELNYYLPEDFAVIEVTFDSPLLDVDIFGVVISFEDEKRKTYSYEKQELVGIGETKRYMILTKDLSPEIPVNWDFTKVKFISLRYLTENNNPSRIIQRVAIDPAKMSSNFERECHFSSQEETVVCD